MNLKKCFLLLFLLFCLTGCKGDDVRNFKSVGFSISNANFKCSDIKNANLKYLLDNYAILEDGTIYDLSFDLVYKNNTNCKLIDRSKKVSSIYNGEVFMTTDNEIYSFSHSNGVSYPRDENSVASFLLSDDSILKVVNTDNHYYALKKDGNVYDYVLNQSNNSYSISSSSILFDKNSYGAEIIDFNYNGNTGSTFVLTKDKYYRNQVVNESCKKYADVDCVYQIQEDKFLNKYKNKILGYNGNTLILKSGRVLTYSDGAASK